MISDSLRTLTTDLYNALVECGKHRDAERVKSALAGSDDDLATFLVSNDLWGGAGSIADQTRQNSMHVRCDVAMFALGSEQLRLGLVNPRTQAGVEFLRGVQL